MAGRICKIAGCGRPHRGRGMCNSHYMAWRRANPDVPTVEQNTNQAVLDCLPGTAREVATKSGLHVETVAAALKRLNVKATRQVCIYDYRPPTVAGQHWTPLWKAGNGANYRLPKARREAHAREVKQRTRPEFKAKLAAGRVAPAPRASWTAALEAIAA